MRALLASILVVFAIVPYTFVSPPAAQAAAFERTNFSKIQKRKLFVFGYFATLKCNFARSRVSGSEAEALLKKEMLKDADVSLDFLNNKRVNELNNLLAVYLYENIEDCKASEEVIEENIEIFLELVGLAEFVEEENPLPSGKDWLNRREKTGS